MFYTRRPFLLKLVCHNSPQGLRTIHRPVQTYHTPSAKNTNPATRHPMASRLNTALPLTFPSRLELQHLKPFAHPAREDELLELPRPTGRL